MPDYDSPTFLRIDVGDVTLAADAYGGPDNPSVVLFHGGGQTRHSWGNTAAQLGANGWYAMSVDMRGHGDSGWSPDGVYDMTRFSGDVRTVARSMPNRPALVGASLGGTSSLLAIGESDEPVATALVLVDVAPRIETVGVERIRTFMESGMDGFVDLDEAADAIAAYTPHRPRPDDLSGLKKNLRQHEDGRWYWHWDPAFMTPVSDAPALDGMPHKRYVSESRLSEAARRITVPTLLVRGGASDLLSEAGAQHLLSLLPDAHYANVAGAGHMVAGDRNDRFNAAVVEFLEGVRAAGPSGTQHGA
jgi:pimeloyl-ACP methyl ester carboxylesterase